VPGMSASHPITALVVLLGAASACHREIADTPPPPVASTSCDPAPLTVHGVRFPGVLCRPASAAPELGVVLVPGTLYLDVDGNVPAFGVFPNTYRELAEQLAARGVAVLRHAKIGPQTGSEVLDPAAAARHAHFETRTEVTAAAIAALRAAVPSLRRVVLVGHSEGGVVALRAVAREPVAGGVAGVALLSTPSTGALDLLREQMRPLLSPDERAYFDNAVAGVRRGEGLPDDAASHPSMGALSFLSAADLGYLREVDAVDPVGLVARYPGPVLIVQGDRDTLVAPHHAAALARAHADRPTRRVELPGLQHFYKQVPEGLAPMAALGLTTPTSPEVAGAIAAWLRALGAGQTASRGT